MRAPHTSIILVNGLRQANLTASNLKNNGIIAKTKISRLGFNFANLSMILSFICHCCVLGEIGKDHIRIELNPNAGAQIPGSGLFGHTFIIDQELGGNNGERRDYTGADFVLATGDGNNTSFKFVGTWLDDGVSVFELKEGDIFSEEGIRAGLFRELVNDPLNPDSSAGTVDFSEPVYLGFRTPLTFLDPIFGGGLRGIGWAKVEMGPISIDQPILRILDHAMEYGGTSILVGESQREPEGLPVARFGEGETLINLERNVPVWASGDFNADERTDLLLPHKENGFEVWQQQNDHTFSKMSGSHITKFGTPDAIGDVDGDGDLDVWISLGGLYEGDSTSSLWLNQGDGTFTESVQTLPPSETTKFSDLDNDGDLDAVTNNSITDFKSEIQTWLNDGDGIFSHHSTLEMICGPWQGGSELGDLNGDGFADLFYVCGGPARVAFNQGDGTFVDSEKSYVNTDFLTTFPGNNLSLNDMDGDGDLDAVIPNDNFKNALWVNNGEGEFTLATEDFVTASKYVSVGDIDTDGDMDILFHTTESVRNWQTDPSHLILYLNEGSHLYVRAKSFPVESQWDAPRFIDIDDDNDLDILIRINQELIVFRNTIEYIIPTPPSDGLEIPDEGLKRGILTALGKKPFEGVTEEDMASLEVLDLSRATRGSTAPIISDFSSLEKAVNLVELDISGSSFFNTTPSFSGSNLSFLESLKKLKKLTLTRNNLSQIRLPSEMTQLEELDLSSNNLRHLTIPTGYESLKELRIEFNQLSRLVFPEDLMSLELLHAAGNQLQRFEFPEHMIHLKDIDLGVNQLSSLKFPQAAFQMEKLKLRFNSLREVTFPINNPNLWWLDLGNSFNRMGDYGFLSQFSGLKELHVTDRSFNLSTLPTPLSKLETLNIDLETGKHLEIPMGMNLLKNLSIQARHLTTISFPSDLNHLESLNIYSERIREITMPKGMNRLQNIAMFGGRLESITFANDMPMLEVIELTDNRLQTFVIPEGVGAQSERLPSAWLRGNPLRSIRTPSRWRSGVHSNQPLISVDRLSVDEKGNVRIPVKAEFGMVILEKSTDLENWILVDEIQFQGGDGTKYHRNQNIQEAPSAFYRVRMK